MPSSLKRICTYPGCNTLTLTGRCANHQPNKDRRSSRERGYDYHWTRLRNAYIRAHPVCEIREKCSGDVAAVEVDHIQPIAAEGERLDPDNLQSTCKLCHAWKTATFDARGLVYQAV